MMRPQRRAELIFLPVVATIARTASMVPRRVSG